MTGIPGQTDRIEWFFLQIETDLASYYRNFQAYYQKKSEK